MGRPFALEPEWRPARVRNQPRLRWQSRAWRSKAGAALKPHVPFAPTFPGARILFALSTCRPPSLELFGHVVLFALDRPDDGDLPRGRFGRKRGRRGRRCRRVGLKSRGLRRLHGGQTWIGGGRRRLRLVPPAQGGGGGLP